MTEMNGPRAARGGDMRTFITILALAAGVGAQDLDRTSPFEGVRWEAGR